MALRTARIACFEHESLHAMIDICPPENSEVLFDVDSSSWAVAKIYNRHDELEGMQFRDQREIETQSELPVVIRELADRFYEEFSDGLERGERESPDPGLTVV